MTEEIIKKILVKSIKVNKNNFPKKNIFFLYFKNIIDHCGHMNLKSIQI